MYEETGAVDFALTPLNACPVRETAGDPGTPGINYGMLYYGDITELGPTPEGYEIIRTALFREPPANRTYPDIQPVLLGYLKARLQESGDGGANNF